MSSNRTDFLSGLEFYFITKRLVKAQHKILVETINLLGGTVSECLTESTSHILCPRGVNYQAALASLKSMPMRDTASLVNIDWLPVCIKEGKLIPTAQFEVKQMETSESGNVSESIAQSGPSNSQVRKQIRFNCSGTSKFPAARDVLGMSGKQVMLRRTLAYGSKYGIGVFCLFETGEQQIGWVPEKDKNSLECIGTACLHTSLQAKIDEASCKPMGGQIL